MTEEKMTAQKISELRDGLKTFLFAGHDTTSCMLTWALWELMCSPSDMDLCVKEANETFAKGFEAEFEDIKGAMMHTFNVLRETLRIHSVVPVVTRQLNEDDELGGMRVPKGAIVVVNMRGVHHRADIWPGGDPEKFRPSRFGVAATTSPLTGLNGIDPWAFLPFINGPRNCLGQHFSLLESRVIVAMLMQRYVFTPAKGQTGECHAYKIPITPVDGMWVNIQRRK
jgi:cytochrome P450